MDCGANARGLNQISNVYCLINKTKIIVPDHAQENVNWNDLLSN